jgi:hypothetical protein
LRPPDSQKAKTFAEPPGRGAPKALLQRIMMKRQ